MPSSHTTQNELHWEALGKNYSNVWQPYAKQVMSSKEMHAITKTLKKNGTVLDVGVGNGRIIESLLATGTPAKIYGIDIAKKMVDICRKKYAAQAKVAQLKVCDLANQELPFTQKFSTISAIRVVKYNPNWQNMIERMARQLEPGGSMVFSMLNKRSLNFFSRYHIPLYKTSYVELMGLAERLDLEVVNIETFTRIPDVFYTLSKNMAYQKTIVAVENALAKVFGKAFLGREFFVTFKRKTYPELPALAKLPLVSVVVPTKNSASFIEACLRSIKAQNYNNIELVVVDNFSTDDTPKIAKNLADAFYTQGPERCAQRNFGAQKTKGKYIVFIDSDMELSPNVIAKCVQAITTHKAAGVIIPESSFGNGFWAQCKKLEKSFYEGVDWIEAARFFAKSTFNSVGQYNESLISGEDWDLSNRIKKMGGLVRISEKIYHNEGSPNLGNIVKKKSFYAAKMHGYLAANSHTNAYKESLGVIRRFLLYLSHPIKLFKRPLVGIGMLFMRVCEFGYGTLGWAFGR